MDNKKVLSELLEDLNNNYNDLLYPKKFKKIKNGKKYNKLDDVVGFSSDIYRKYVGRKRYELLIECIRWPSNNKIVSENWENAKNKGRLKETEFYKNDKYRIICKKPGMKKWDVNKRSKKKLRKQDFRPELEINGNDNLVLDFAELFSPFFIEKNKAVGWILFLVFFRLSFMLDHKLIQGKYRMSFEKLPNTKNFLDSQKIFIKSKVKAKIIEIPIMVYLNNIEAVLIAEDSYVFINSKEWFDDKKAMAVYTPEFKNKKSANNTWDHGRVNTALTFCNVIKSSLVGDELLGVPELLQVFITTRGMGQIKRKVFVEKIEELSNNR